MKDIPSDTELQNMLYDCRQCGEDAVRLKPGKDEYFQLFSDNLLLGSESVILI